VKGLENKSAEEWLKELFRLEKRRHKGSWAAP